MEMTTDMLAPHEVFAPAAPAELNALALLTINPEEYVAQVFAPFRSKLAALKAEADTIHFTDNRMFDAPHRYVDIGTTAGMAIAVKVRAGFRDDVRLDAEKTKTARKAPILQIGRLIDSTYKEIVEEVAPYEGKFDTAIKAEEKRKADIAAAKERAKAERIGAIKAAIEAIRALPVRAEGKSADELRALLERVAARTVTKEEFAEFADEAQSALDTAGQELVGMFEAAQQREAIAAEAEAARIAEAARLAAEQAAADKRRADEAAENTRVAADNQRIANELAIERERQADQQAAIELLAKQQAEQAEANLKADAAARAEVARKAQAAIDQAAAEAQAQLAAVQAQIAEAKQKLADDQAAEDARKAALAVQEAADAVRDEAFKMDAQIDMAVAMAAALTPADVPEPAAADAALFDAADEAGAAPEATVETDIEFLSSLADGIDITLSALLARIDAIDFDAVRAELATAI